MTTTIDPRLASSAVEWADYMYPTIEFFGVPARLMDEGDWQNWANGLLSIGSLAELGVPHADQFTDWRDWAMRFNDVINQGS